MSMLQKRILGSVLVGVIIVGGAFWASKQKVVEQRVQTPEAAVGILSGRKHITVTDSDQDGVPDWQAHLVPGDPIYLDATSSSSTTEIPDNVSGRFTQRFFSDVMVLDSLGELEQGQDQLVRDSIAQLEEETKAPQYTRADLKNIIVTNNKEALRAYGNLVVGNIMHYQTDEETEFEVYQRLTRDENPRHLKKLALIEGQYTDIINALLELEVPEQYVFEHLAIINNMSELRENVIGLQLYFDDPFYALMRYRRLSADALGTSDVLGSLYDALYLDAKVQFADDDIMPYVVKMLR